jgi:hypothetical protein
MSEQEKLFIDGPCVSSMFFGEYGWFLSRWVGYLRHLKFEVYKDHKFLLVCPIQYKPLVQDFVDVVVDLPDEFRELNLETDCFEAPLPNSPPGSLTPPKVYADMLTFMRQFYDLSKTVEALPPRGAAFDITNIMPQIFCKYSAPPINLDKPIISVFPRARNRASNRNVPAFIWKEVVDSLIANDFIVVLGGTPNGSCLADYMGENIINLIPYNENDKLALIMGYLSNSVCSISSQSGLTHLSLACDTPSYIIGHEKERHTVKENRLDTPTSFRYVSDYRAIDAQTILEDIQEFIRLLKEKGWVDKVNYSEILKRDIDILDSLIQKGVSGE